MILLLDNFDSFVHNLARYFQRLGQETLVVRSDAVDVATVERLGPAAVVLSPGPCGPRQAGHSLEIMRHFQRRLPMLGVCLGQQILAEALGGRIGRAPQPVHGRTSPVYHDGTGLFAGVPAPFRACRYHSLLVESLPEELTATAHSDDGLVMALAHRELPLYGVQFHPEAILTEHGYQLLANFLLLAGLAPIAETEALSTSERCFDRELPSEPVGPVTF